MYLLVILLPFFGFLTLAFFGRLIGGLGATVVSTTLIGVAACLSLLVYYEVVVSGACVQITLFEWFSVGLLQQSCGFLYDSVTSVMLVVVLVISFFVHLYSSSYMAFDPHLVRFMSYLSLFTFFMLLLVSSDNYVQMFLGWEGVGISSYLLINFWFTRLAANKAALKAVIVNRFGDFSLAIGLFLVYFAFRTFDYSSIFALAQYLQNFYITLIVWEFHALSVLAVFLFLGCVGKSAQLGLHTWLPDAMEGPTPVSALIHAATMVTAGVFILIRFAPILEFAPGVLSFITLIGGLTAFFAASIGVFQNDLKRVIAYSTCSQLGYMVLACGLSNYSVALFHLFNHAFFKALLFLSAGSVIHALVDEQDMRRMGGLLKVLPFTYFCFFAGSLALMGFPFTSGFYSKDFILELAFGSSSSVSLFGYLCVYGAALCTAFYSFRLIIVTFLHVSNTNRSLIKYVLEPDFRMTIPLCFLLILSMFSGYLFRDTFVGMATHTINFSYEFSSLFESLSLNSEFLFAYEKVLPFFGSIFASLLAVYFYVTAPAVFQFTVLGRVNLLLRKLLFFFNKKWYFDVIYNTYLVYPLLRLGYHYTFKMIDRGIIELLGPTGLVRLWASATNFLNVLQSGFLFNYIFGMVLGVTLCVVFAFNLMYVDLSDITFILILLISFVRSSKYVKR
jgi:NADH-ubiquinone oxidoreductase chain 5